MRTLIVYQSYFGNTRLIASSLARHFKELGEVVLYDIERHQNGFDFTMFDLILIGSPTRYTSISAPMKRFLQSPKVKRFSDLPVVAFDTRYGPQHKHSVFMRFLIQMFGYGVTSLEKRLDRLSIPRLLDGEGFSVEAAEGPLSEHTEKRVGAFVARIVVAMQETAKTAHDAGDALDEKDSEAETRVV
ncbi:MAG: hypothetical protein EA374_01395 [Acholeplasmatales bacterium]|nr:MAG: hypothetical protein EA374_01395 [Acholeplasmatales bacterium]